MATTGLDTFDRSVQKSNEWLKDLMERLGTDDRRYAYRVLRAYFHLLRDRLTVDEAAQLAAQLPHLLRGMFYEGWDPSRTPETYRHREEFLSRLADRAQLAGPTEASVAAEAATQVLRARIAEGEVEDVLHVLPASIRTLLQPAEREGVSPEAAGGLGRPKPWYSAPQARQAQEVPHAREDPARRR
jgi:uncharacterized protein (DUF2267 family)